MSTIYLIERTNRDEGVAAVPFVLYDAGWFTSEEAAQAHIDTHLMEIYRKRYAIRVASIKCENANIRRATTLKNKELAALQAAGLRTKGKTSKPRLINIPTFEQWSRYSHIPTFEVTSIEQAI